jgi:para-nitrobenzyl esterase
MQNKIQSRSKVFLNCLMALVLAMGLAAFTNCDQGDHPGGGHVRPAKPYADPIAVTGGKVSGMKQDDCHLYRGIPYAAPPVGDLRWKPPQPVVPWTGVLDATAWPNRAPQPEDGIGLGKISEDCLYLNLTTPAKTKSDRLPVMVFFHGGGLINHTGNSLLYNNTALPIQGVIVVTVNMRLGAMGFLAHPALSAESPEGASGNYGALDMIAALKWVQKNIANFGGDKNKVTIFGESGGGSKVLSMMASPLAAGLFHRAIVESGSGSASAPAATRTLAANEAIGKTFQTALGITGVQDADALAAMRAKTMEEVVAATYSPAMTVDGYVLEDTVSGVFSNGLQNNVPLMVGAQTRDLGTDLTVGVPGLANKMSAIQPNTYVYVFSHVPANWRSQPKCAAFHGLELPYVFGYIPEGLNASIIAMFATPSYCLGAPGYDESDYNVADYSVRMWAQFAKTGNPNYPGIKNFIEGNLKWPAYAQGEGTNYYLEIADPMKVGTDPASAYIPTPAPDPIAYHDSTYGFTITYPDNLLPATAVAPVIWRVSTPIVVNPWAQAMVRPVSDGATLVEVFATHLRQQTPAQSITTTESTGTIDINGVSYEAATVVNNASMRSKIIGIQINDGTQWIIFETTQHINFGMPTGILESVVWD